VASGLRAAARTGAWSLAFWIVGLTLTAVLTQEALLASEGPGAAGIWADPSVRGAFLQALIGIVVFSLLTTVVGRYILGVSWTTLAGGGSVVRGFGKGFLLAAAVALVPLVIGVLTGHAAWRFDGGSFGAYVGRLALLAAVLLPAAFMEEIAFRGVPLVAMSQTFGRLGALLITSGVFGLLHLQNPGITPLGAANISAAGLFLGVLFFAPGGLGTATGAHLGWNLTLAGLGAPVSGLPFQLPWLDYHPGGPIWLTGGEFGPEGGLLATLALGLGIAAARRWTTTEETV
jgi:membrane protease YdiL (CAAX protease family)